MKRAVLLALVVSFSPAQARAESADEALRKLAQLQTHGWADVDLSYEQLEAKLAAGERIYVPCGKVAILGQRLLTRLGIPARLVGTFANTRGDLLDVPEDTLESHALLEVWTGERWEVYDLDGNVRAVDEHGAGVGIEAFADGPRHYDPLTDESDTLHSLDESPYPAYEAWLFSHHEDWYDRVLGTVTIMPHGGSVYYFTDPTLKDTLDPMPGYEWVDAERWKEIVAAPPAPPPVVKPPTPAIPPTPTLTGPPVPVAPTGAARRPVACRLGRREVRRRGVSCDRARRVLRRHLRGRPVKGWRCRTRNGESACTRGQMRVRVGRR